MGVSRDTQRNNEKRKKSLRWTLRQIDSQRKIGKETQTDRQTEH